MTAFLEPYEIQHALDILMEHYRDGEFAQEEDKPMTQIQRNMRCKIKKQLEEFCNTKQKSVFMMCLFAFLNILTIS